MASVQTSRPLELLHIDLMGPARVQSLVGKRYILVIVDDFTRYTWVVLLKDKGEAPEKMIHLCKKLQVEKNTMIARIKIDHGREFENTKLATFCNDQGTHQANLLSLAGRAVLIQASSMAIPAYVMQCTHISNKILEGIDRANRNFLWGSLESSKKIHWVGWHKVAKSKEEGGLGLQIAKGRNTALLAKLNWRFHVEKEAIWAKVLRQKYYSNRRINSANADRHLGSHIWKALKKGRSTFNEGSMWTIGRDSKVSFWWENWTGKGALRCMIQGPLTQGVDQWKVGDILSNLCWD